MTICGFYGNCWYCDGFCSSSSDKGYYKNCKYYAVKGDEILGNCLCTNYLNVDFQTDIGVSKTFSPMCSEKPSSQMIHRTGTQCGVNPFIGCTTFSFDCWNNRDPHEACTSDGLGNKYEGSCTCTDSRKCWFVDNEFSMGIDVSLCDYKITQSNNQNTNNTSDSSSNAGLSQETKVIIISVFASVIFTIFLCCFFFFRKMCANTKVKTIPL